MSTPNFWKKKVPPPFGSEPENSHALSWHVFSKTKTQCLKFGVSRTCRYVEKWKRFAKFGIVTKGSRKGSRNLENFSLTSKDNTVDTLPCFLQISMEKIIFDFLVQNVHFFPRRFAPGSYTPQKFSGASRLIVIYLKKFPALRAG